MKRILQLLAIVSSLSSYGFTINDDWSYEVNPYATYASSFIYNSGSVCDENPVIQIGTDNYLTYKNFSLYHGVFQNYGLNTIKEVYKRNGLDDLEFYIGGFYSLDHWTFGLVYEYWYFPNLLPGYGTSEQVLHPSVTYAFDPITYDKYDLGKFTIGFDPYIYLANDPYNYLVDWRPYLNHKVKLFSLYDNDVNLNSRVGTVFRSKQKDGNSGWSSTYLKFTISYRGFSVFYYHWFQMDSDVYSDWNYDKSHNTMGISYSFSF